MGIKKRSSTSHRPMKNICKLCHTKGTLRNSHIFPEFTYKLMYDDKHRYNILSTVSNHPSKLVQKGVREKLLCQACETKLSKYEGYASRAFDGKEISLPLINEKLKGIAIVPGIDYKKFRLFQLSLLWRASAAEGDFFKQVDLKEHEDAIRQMILQENPGEPHQYGCLISGFVVNGEMQADAIINPEQLPVGEHYCYRFILGGFFWMFFISGHPSEKKYIKLFLTKAGTLAISFDENLSEQFARELALDLKRAGKI